MAAEAVSRLRRTRYREMQLGRWRVAWEKLLAVLLVPLLVGCSDQRMSFDIASSKHSLTLIRVQNFFWERWCLPSG